MYALASLGLRCSAGGFCVAGAALGALQVAFAWQARQLVVCKGSDVRPGVPWSPLAFAWHSLTHSARGRMHALASLGLCCSAGGFCVAGAALGALQGVGCAPWRPLVSAALPVAFAWQAQHLVLCKGSDVRSGVPWSPVAFAWQARHLVLCKGSDVRPGVPWSPVAFAWQAFVSLQGVGCMPWRPLVSAALPVAYAWQGRRSTWCSARGRMYALASLGLRCSAGGFCVAGAALGALQQVRCTPWRPLVSAALPVAFAWQAQHLVLCKGSDVRLASLGLRCSAGGFCVAGAALGALQGVGCTPWRPLVSAALPVAFAWQAQHLVLSKKSDVRPGVPWSPLLCRWLLRGRRSTWCSARGRMYALASLGLRWLLRGRRGTWYCVQGVGCTLWRPLVSGGFCVAGAALGALQGVGCTPWRPLVSAALPVAFAWQGRHLVLCKGSDVRPGVPWSPVAFAWQAQHLVLCKGSDVRPGVPWSPLAFAWQARHLVLCKGSDVRPGVPWSPLLCRWILILVLQSDSFGDDQLTFSGLVEPRNDS